MKNILKIYRSTLKQAVSNWVVIIVVLGLCILPSLYAWFYLKSSRDPYGNTKGLKVAVVNQDLGVFFREKRINIGQEVVEELAENENIGWIFVDEQLAQQGVERGAYYASIVIETGFSEKLITLLDAFPQNPEITYTVNEKINAIAPKITSKGASTIKENIQKSFIDTINRVVMEKFNIVASDLKSTKQSVFSLIDFVHDASKSIDRLDQTLNKMLELSYRSRFKLEETYGKIPEVKTSLEDAQTTLDQSARLAQNSLNLLNTMPEKITDYRQEIQKMANTLDDELARTLNTIEEKNQIFSDDVRLMSSKLSSLEQQLTSQLAGLKQLKSLIASFLPDSKLIGKIDQISAKLTQIASKSASVRGNLTKATSGIQNAVDFGQEQQSKLRDFRRDLKSDLDTLSQDYKNDIEPLITEVLSDISTMSEKGSSKLQKREQKLPDIESNLSEGVDILNTEIDKIKSFQEKLPILQASVHSIDNKLQTLKNGKIDEVIQLAGLNPQRFAEFVSEPILLTENRLFPIPNYGSAMSPFFTTLAIWVGSLLNISLFTTKTRSKFAQACKPYQQYLGKWLFFLTVALLQATVVSLGDMRLLDAYVANPGTFFFLSLWIATVFSMIIFTTVATFGNAGKAIVIVFLVLQLSGSGGTFPIELSGAFFQAINPFLPFTYAIAAMRETVGGIVPEIFWPNVVILLGFFGVFLLIGLVIKPLIAKQVHRFEKRFAESELGEH